MHYTANLKRNKYIVKFRLFKDARITVWDKNLKRNCRKNNLYHCITSH